MNRNYLMLLLAVFSPVLVSLAQVASPTPDPDLPTAPFLAKAPDLAQWEIDVTQKQTTRPTPTPVPLAGSSGNLPTQAPEKILRKSVITKTKNIVREVNYFTDGTQAENWSANGFLMKQHPTGRFISITNPKSDRAAAQSVSVDFEMFNWVDLAHFAKAETKRGAKCFAYNWQLRAPSDTDLKGQLNYAAQAALYEQFAGKPKVPTMAWVERETRLPVAVEDENATYNFNFQSPPTDVLTLPPDFQKAWDQYKNVMDEWKKHVMPKQQ